MTRILSRKLLSVLLALVIVAAMALTLASCGKSGAETKTDDTTTAAPADTAGQTGNADDTAGEPADSANDTGDTAPAAEKTITVEVVNDKGEKSEFTIKTARETLADALLDEKLVEGDMSEEYGLMIVTVNGLRADYNADGAYWAMYQDGEYMMTGASQTVIADGDHYELVYTKA
ncbi:MAG: DUF4430 domain-containing protein [Clostridia bacterium]|nr:DUF4430 domain-containing protein [Clostridia bacterium]